MRVTLIRTLVAAMGVIALVTTGCERENDSWPPVSSQLHQKFSQKQDGLEVLANELVDNGYSSIAIWSDGSLRATVHGSDGYEEVDIEDPQKWNDLFGNAGVDTAENYSDQVRLHNRFEHAGIFDDKVFDYEFVKSAETYPPPICKPRLSSETCGGCEERIDDDWHLRIIWYPSQWITEFEEVGASKAGQHDDLMSRMQLKAVECMDEFFDRHPFESRNRQ